jgi:hypothetical protein
LKQISKGLLVFLTLFFALIVVAKPKRYEVILPAVQTAHTQLKAGTYQVEVEGATATFFLGNKEVCKVAVRTEELAKKVDSSSVEVTGDKLVSIELVNSKIRLIVSE